MYLSYGSIALLCVGICALWFWQDSLRVRELANDAAMQACRRLGLQFLDGTVAFSRLRPVRDKGQLRLRRTYVFDYTAQSVDRMQGFVLMLGANAESVGFARQPQSHREIDEIQIHPTANSTSSSQMALPDPHHETRPTRPQSAGKVLDMDEWRKRHMHH